MGAGGGPQERGSRGGSGARRRNLSDVLRRVHGAGPCTRAELTEELGLSRSAIKGLVGELAHLGLVTEGEAVVGRSGRGRPSPRVSPCADQWVVLAGEVLVDATALALVGLGGVVHERVTLTRGHGRDAMEEVATDLAALASELAERLPAPSARIGGVGLAVAGLTSGGVVEFGPNLGWRHADIAAAIRKRLPVDLPVRVGNEANLGALAEHLRGAAAGSDDLVYVSGEVGVGAGCIVAGRLLTGSRGYAGELGHIPLNPWGRPCRCGSTGCAETECGLEALRSRLAARREGVWRTGDVLTALEAGDEEAEAALAETGWWLGQAVRSAASLLNPDVVVLGGQLARFGEPLTRAVASELAGAGLAETTGPVRVTSAAAGADSALHGAAELAFEELLSEPTVAGEPGWPSSRTAWGAGGADRVPVAAGASPADPAAS